MKPISTHAGRLALAAMALGFALSAPVAVAQDNAPVRISPDARLTPFERERLQMFADRGIDSLRRYVWITRSFRNYNMSDLLDPRY